MSLLMSNSASMNSIGETGTYLLRTNAEIYDLPNNSVIFTLTQPTLSEIREKVRVMISRIDSMLLQKFNTTWKLYFDNSFEFWINLPTHELREFITDFLHKLAPDDKVELVPWCYKERNRITRLTRAIYVILGNQPNIDLRINRLGHRTSNSF
ncbi:MAG: hypothetical protein ACFFD2_28755, partial [Promethearchaeota archaeon]